MKTETAREIADTWLGKKATDAAVERLAATFPQPDGWVVYEDMTAGMHRLLFIRRTVALRCVGGGRPAGLRPRDSYGGPGRHRVAVR